MVQPDVPASKRVNGRPRSRASFSWVVVFSSLSVLACSPDALSTGRSNSGSGGGGTSGKGAAAEAGNGAGDNGGSGGDGIGGRSTNGGKASSAGGASKALDDPANRACLGAACKTPVRRVEPMQGPSCPAGSPKAGDACKTDKLECSYGGSVAAFCRSYFECTGGVWAAKPKATCVEQPASFCPSQPSHGTKCTVGQVDVFVPCEYQGGIGCYCLGNPLGVPGAAGEWECYGPPANAACPEVLPNLGDACKVSGQFCNYGGTEQGCHSPYADVYCYDGAWEASSATCTL